jgi:hypothetical protein
MRLLAIFMPKFNHKAQQNLAATIAGQSAVAGVVRVDATVGAIVDGEYLTLKAVPLGPALSWACSALTHQFFIPCTSYLNLEFYAD